MARGKRRALTAELVKTICEAIEAGNTRECAAQAAGASVDWLYAQMRENPEFQAAIARADALAEKAHVQVIQTSARRGNANASMWWLERRRAQDWGKTVKVDLELRVRTMAQELGLDPDEAVEEAQRILQGNTRAAPR